MLCFHRRRSDQSFRDRKVIAVSDWRHSVLILLRVFLLSVLTLTLYNLLGLQQIQQCCKDTNGHTEIISSSSQNIYHKLSVLNPLSS